MEVNQLNSCQPIPAPAPTPAPAPAPAPVAETSAVVSVSAESESHPSLPPHVVIPDTPTSANFTDSRVSPTDALLAAVTAAAAPRPEVLTTVVESPAFGPAPPSPSRAAVGISSIALSPARPSTVLDVKTSPIGGTAPSQPTAQSPLRPATVQSAAPYVSPINPGIASANRWSPAPAPIAVVFQQPIPTYGGVGGSDSSADCVECRSLTARCTELSNELINKTEDAREYERKYFDIQSEGSRLYDTYDMKCKQLKEVNALNVSLREQNTQLTATTRELEMECGSLKTEYERVYNFSQKTKKTSELSIAELTKERDELLCELDASRASAEKRGSPRKERENGADGNDSGSENGSPVRVSTLAVITEEDETAIKRSPLPARESAAAAAAANTANGGAASPPLKTASARSSAFGSPDKSGPSPPADALAVRVAELTAQLAAAEAERQHAMERVKELEIRNAALEASATATAAPATAAAATTATALTAKTDECNALTKRVIALEQGALQSHLVQKLATERNNSLSEQKVSAEAKLAKVTAQLTEVSAASTKFEAGLTAARSELTTAAATIERLTAENSSKSTALEASERQRAAKAAEWTANEQRLNEAVKAYTEQIELQSKEMSALQSELNGLKKERDETNEFHASERAITEEAAKEAESKLIALEASVQTLTKERNELQQRLAGIEPVHSELVLEHEETKAKLATVSKQNTETERKLSKRIEMVTALEKSVAQHTETITQLQSKLSAADQSITKLSANASSESEHKINAQKECEKLSSFYSAELARLNETIRTDRIEIDTRIAAVNALRSELDTERKHWKVARDSWEKERDTTDKELKATSEQFAVVKAELEVRLESRSSLALCCLVLIFVWCVVVVVVVVWSACELESE